MDSASGTSKTGRDKHYQAIFPLKGVPLNTNNTPFYKILNNAEFSDLTYILTRNKAGIGKNFKPEDLKYKKIFILSDADIDGLHIRSLMTLFFYRHFPGLIEGGHLYISLPPLYSVVERGKKHYFLNDEEYEDYIYKVIKKTYQLDKIKITKKLLTRMEIYQAQVDHIVNNTGMNEEIVNIITTIMYKLTNPKQVLSYMKKALPDVEYKKHKKDIIVQGLVGDEYVNTTVKELLKTGTICNDKLKELQLLPVYKYAYKNSEQTKPVTDLYKTMIETATPKSRQRLKGLGEMNSEDLWETTLDPDRRRCIQVTIADVDKAHETLDNLFNSKTKYSDIRKKFISENQDSIIIDSIE